jgi:hypothetical protein
MSKKPVVATFLQTAPVKVVEPPKPAPLEVAPVVQSPYADLLKDMPGDPAAKAWLLEQVEISRSWGAEILRIQSDLLIAILDKALEAK